MNLKTLFNSLTLFLLNRIANSKFQDSDWKFSITLKLNFWYWIEFSIYESVRKNFESHKPCTKCINSATGEFIEAFDRGNAKSQPQIPHESSLSRPGFDYQVE